MKKKGIVILSVLIVVLITFLGSFSQAQADPGVIYVDIDATGANDGTSWGDAFPDLQSAMASALPGDELWVAEGVYKPTSGIDRSSTFQLLDNVALFGGFSGTETSLGERYWVAHPTILSGDIGTEGDASDNSYHVVTGSGTDASAVLDGFTVTGGRAEEGIAAKGAGIIIESANPTLINLIIQDNHAVSDLSEGGGLANSGALTLTNCTFSDNSATYGGGGIFNGGTLTMIHSTFSGNNAKNGGGIENLGTLTLIDSTFTGNNALDGRGGGIYNFSGTLTVTNSTFSGNSATNNGGGIYNFRGTLTVTNNTFSDNNANSGGGIINFDTLTVTNSTFSGNNATQRGGDLINSGTLTVTNSTFSDNSATQDGGGIYNAGATPLNLVNTILANSNAGKDCHNIGTMGTGVNNLIEENFGCGTPVSAADPGLGPLQDNGGPTHTMAIGPTSPAFNAGDDGLCPATDQRGVTRPQGSACDIGAFESEFLPAAPMVNSLNDPGDGICDSSECTLREAIAALPAGGTIDFDASLSGGTITIGSTLTLDKDLTIDGMSLASPIIISGGGSVRVFRVSDVATATLQGLDIVQGYSAPFLGVQGAGILNQGTLTISSCSFSDNNAPNGGGSIMNSGTLTVEYSTFSDNLGYVGGAIVNAGMLSVTNSTFSGNNADQDGGGIYNHNTLTVTNSTFSGNSADSGSGGAIYNAYMLAVANNTFSGNSANVGGGGIYNWDDGTLKLVNTILANSPEGGDCHNDGTMGTDSTHNLIEANSDCGTPISSTDPLLGPLQDNGGPTHTMSITTASPAFDNGDDGLCPATDQRGLTRPQGSACDIGAYEVASPLALDDTATKVDDSPVTIDVLANDSDPLYVDSVSDPFNGTVGINTDDTLTYTPDPGFTGSDVFTYIVSDGFGGTATAKVTIFSFTDLGNLGASAFVGLWDINNFGQAVGLRDADAISWTADGGMQVLEKLSPTGDAFAFGINDSGHIVGGSQAPSGQCHAVIWNAEGVLEEDLGTFGGSQAFFWSINNHGQAVGRFSDVSGHPHAFLWDNGTFHDLGTFDGGGYSEAYDINDAGKIVGVSSSTTYGQRPFIWTETSGMEHLVDPEDLGNAKALGINNAGQVVGYAFFVSSGIQGPFLWTADSGIQYLGSISEDWTGGEARDINNQGQVIGFNRSEIGSLAHSFLWTEDDGMQDLGEMGGPYRINDLGQAVGFAMDEVAAYLWMVPNLNNWPTAVDDTAAMLKDTPVTVDVLANDTDIDGDPLTIDSASDPTFGSVVNNGDGTLTYTPQADFYGGDSFTYTVSDGKGGIGTAMVALVPAIRNDTWTRAYELQLSSSEAIKQVLERPYQSRWFRFDVTPGSEIVVTLTGLPANYDLTLYSDITAAYQELNSPEDLLLLSAEFAPDMFSPDMFSPDMFSPDMFSPDMFSPDMFSPDMFSPDMFSPDMFSPDMFSPDMFSPDMFSPDMFSPDMFSPDMFSPDMFSPDMFSPDMFSPDMFSPDPATFASAQLRSIIAVSALDGTAAEGLRVNSWNNSGEFYVRVTGRNGAFDPDDLFHLEVTVDAGVCGSVDPTLPPSSTTGVNGNYKTIVITDLARMTGTEADKVALEDAVAAFIVRNEVVGVWVDVGSDARVEAANILADANTECPYAKNLVAESIKEIIDSYRDAGNPLEYIVVIGNDNVVPFFRYPDNALLANEMNYSPPVLEDTSSQASLKLGYVLGQDEYGSRINLIQKGSIVPLPDLSIGRLVETPTDVMHMLAVYTATQEGVLDTPATALVTGYDFLADAAAGIKSELRAGLGIQNLDAVESLITDRAVAPQLVCSPGITFVGQCSWTSEDMWSALLDRRHDIIFLAGHFSASSWLAPDNQTRLVTTDLEAAGVDLENALIFSTGCHSGYNIVNEHNVPDVTREPDWAQAFARKGATFIGGTGYQYGDTDFVEYSERLYLEFSRQLRVGTGPVSIGNALMVAKQTYLADTALMTGIHEKSLLQATLFGLPMLSIDLPFGRTTPETDISIVTATDPLQISTDLPLGLSYADVVLEPELTMESVTLENSPTDSVYLSGSDGVVSSPSQPVLPLEMYNVSVVDNVLRGVGFRGGSYTDVADKLPLTGAPATEIRGVHTPFFTDYFYPVRPWNVNYFGALAEMQGEMTRLVLMPAQYKSSSYGSITGTLRQFNSVDLRLYYSANTTSYTHEESGLVFVPAQAAPPKIADISTVYDSQESRIDFQATVVGDPAAGIQEVWIVYTIDDGLPGGEWLPVDLTQDGDDSRIWRGSLSGVSPSDVRYMVQAVNGVGLVAYATNLGAYYTPGADPGAPPPATQEPTEIILDAPVIGAYGESITVSATLTSDGDALSEEMVVFGLGAQSRLAVTDEYGYAEASFLLLGWTGDATLSVSLPGSEDYASSTAASSFTITKQSTQLSITLQTPELILGEDAVFSATLTDDGGRRLPGKTVLFEVQEAGNGDLVYSEAIETDYTGQARLILPAQPIGQYTLSTEFGGTDFVDPRYYPSSSEVSLVVIYDFSGFFPPVDNLPIVNMVKAGRAIPVKFSLNGDQGLEILDGNPEVRIIACNPDVPLEELTETVPATASSLSYDPSENQYIYVWKTEQQWAGTCRQLDVNLDDGTEYSAIFQFK